ncbi:serine/arginine repetitive matrix protein 1-like [Pangasianodon hypophthalmus]|uniref:serine/arginine repetitive matrix protein 1-like n=1 Tax=Pangasianodon hypophthalmus TaxID=310915 RepID=UPI0023082A64|nr:serine/arginine repetitive matrix protein 1-like [Pangasianodon hypophthalmus]
MADEGKRCKPRAAALVPRGLKALLQSMGWAVLMKQPDNICEFLADYTSELLQYKNENPSLGQREAIIKFHGIKEEALKISSAQAECSKSDIASGIGKESGKTFPNLPLSPDNEQEELPTSGLGKTPSLNRQERSEKSGGDPVVEVVHGATPDTAQPLPRPPSKPKRSSSAALKRSPNRKTRTTKHSKSDGDTCGQMKRSVALAKSSSLQDCVLMSCEVTDKTLQEAPLDREDALMHDEKSPPQFVPDVELLQKAPLDKAQPLPEPEPELVLGQSQAKRRSSAALKRSSGHIKHSKSDGDTWMKRSVALVKSSSLQDCVLMSCEVTDKTLQEAPMKKDAVVSGGESSDGADSTHLSEVSLTPPEPVELLQEDPLDKAQPLPRPPSKPKRSASAALKRSPNRKTRTTKHSKSDGDTCGQMKRSVALAKSSSLQDCVLMSCEVTDKTLQEAPLDREVALMNNEKSSAGVDSTHFSGVSLKSPELGPDVKLLQEAPLDKEDALMSDEKSSDGVDSTHFSEVSLTPPEIVPDFELLQEAPLDRAEHLPRPPSQPKRSSPTALKRPARKTKHSKSDGEIHPQMKQSVGLAKSPSLQDCALEAPLDRVKYLASQRTPKREPSARATLPSKRLSSSSSLASSSPSYSRSPSSEESLSDYYGKANVVYMHKELGRLSPGSSRTSSMAPEKNVPEVKFPPISISSPHRRRPDSHDSRKTGLLRSTEKLKLPQIELRSQRPGPSQDVRARSSEEEDNAQNVAWTLYRLPHRREEGTLSTEVLSQPKYQNGAIIQTIGPGCVVLKGRPSFGSLTDQTRIRGRCYQVSTLDSGQKFTEVNQNSIVIRPPVHRRNDIHP